MASKVFAETVLAVDALKLPAGTGAGKISLSISDLHRARPLSDRTRRWLGDTPVTLTWTLVTFSKPLQFNDGTVLRKQETIAILIDLRGGWKCRITRDGWFVAGSHIWTCRAGNRTDGGYISRPVDPAPIEAIRR